MFIVHNLSRYKVYEVVACSPLWIDWSEWESTFNSDFKYLKFDTFYIHSLNFESFLVHAGLNFETLFRQVGIEESTLKFSDSWTSLFVNNRSCTCGGRRGETCQSQISLIGVCGIKELVLSFCAHGNSSIDLLKVVMLKSKVSIIKVYEVISLCVKKAVNHSIISCEGCRRSRLQEEVLD